MKNLTTQNPECASLQSTRSDLCKDVFGNSLEQEVQGTGHTYKSGKCNSSNFVLNYLLGLLVVIF